MSRLGVFAIATVIQLAFAAGYDWQWRTGRATHYGGPSDPWSIMDGGCHYGFLDPKKATGWDVAAISDVAYDYKDSCGRCYEVRCKPMDFKDNYGEYMQRSSVCYDSSASVIVQVTDVCPCHYPANYYSNKRWCCGDMYHFDLSDWAFEKLTDMKWGVIGIEYRPVPCNHEPAKRAYLPSWKQPTKMTRSWPSGHSDRRPWRL
jgi:hypothetical protein